MYDDRGGRGRQGGAGRRCGNYQRRDDRRGTPLTDLDPALTDMSLCVIGCAIEVHKRSGRATRSEALDANALKGELSEQGIVYKTDHAFPVSYKGKKVGQVKAGLFVGERFIVELLARVGEVGTAERSDLRAGCGAADLAVGLVINFGEGRLKDGPARAQPRQTQRDARRARRERRGRRRVRGR